MVRRISVRDPALLMCLLVALLLNACTTLSSSAKVSLEAAVPWALLPLDNLSTTPQAGEQARTLLETSLRERGVSRVESWQSQQAPSLSRLLQPGADQAEALAWARSQGFVHAFTGTISEWHYRGAPDGEAVVAISLRVLDVATGEVLWQGSASRTGFGYSNLTRVADKVLDALLDEIELR